MTKQIFMAIWLLGMMACTRSEMPVKPANLPSAKVLTTDSALLAALADVPKNAHDHEKTKAVVRWMGRTFIRGHAAPAMGLPGIYQDLTYSPVGAVTVMKALADALQLQSTVIVIDKVPTFGWYPLLEIHDEDGDHLWDPYAGRYAPDYDDTPLSFEHTMHANKVQSLVQAAFQPVDNGVGPPFYILNELPVLSLNPARATALGAVIDFSKVGVAFEVGKPDQSSADIEAGGVRHGLYLPAFAAAGDISGPLGNYSLAHRYTLTGMEPGLQYDLRFALFEGSETDLLLMSRGVTATPVKKVGGLLHAQFYAAQSSGSVVLGVIDQKILRFDFIQWRDY